MIVRRSAVWSWIGLPALIILALLALSLLTGCGNKQVPFLTTLEYEIPAECEVASPPEPKLPADRDIDASVAIEDRQKLKWALRSERSLRAACVQRLKAQRGETKPS